MLKRFVAIDGTRLRGECPAPCRIIACDNSTPAAAARRWPCLKPVPFGGTVGSVIGSRHQIALICKRLIEAGIPAAALPRVHRLIAPAVRAEAPEETAISAAAERILHRAKPAEARA